MLTQMSLGGGPRRRRRWSR